MRTRQFLAALGGTLIAAAVPWRPALAQRQGDYGYYQILEARYGTPGRNVDVTDRLRRLAREDAPIRVTNNVFGVDPAPGEVKVLRIYARARDGGTRVFEYRERDVVDGAQFAGWREGRWGEGGRRGRWDHDDRGRPGDDRRGRGRLVIERASYGDGRRWSDVTERVRSMARGGRLDMRVENETFGFDPTPGRSKSLIVVYSVDGVRQEVRVPERGRLSLP